MTALFSKQTSKQSLGSQGEKLARSFLEAKGYTFIDQNFHSRYGEIDLIMKYHHEYVFVEVKTRTSRQFGTAIESITPSKIQKIYQTAQKYIWTHEHNESMLFQIDAVCIDFENGIPQIEHFKNIGW